MAARILCSLISEKEHVLAHHHSELPIDLDPNTGSKGYCSSLKRYYFGKLEEFLARSDKSGHHQKRTEINRKETEILPNQTFLVGLQS